MLELIALLRGEILKQGGNVTDLDLLLTHGKSLEEVVKTLIREANIHFRGTFRVEVPKKLLTLYDLVLESGTSWVCQKLKTAHVDELVKVEQEALRRVSILDIKVCRASSEMTTDDVINSMDPEVYEPSGLVDILLLKMQFGSYLGRLRVVALGTEIGDLVSMTSYLPDYMTHELSTIRKKAIWPKDTCFPFRLRKK